MPSNSEANFMPLRDRSIRPARRLIHRRPPLATSPKSSRSAPRQSCETSPSARPADPSPRTCRTSRATSGADLGQGDGIGLVETLADHRELFACFRLQAKVRDPALAGDSGDRKVDARVFDHPLGVIVLAHGGLGAEELRVEANVGLEVGHVDMEVVTRSCA
ncbi:MAG: hypothetical protein LC775_10895 [Acidobacteria bacterium]|nr:hypothetical protein [Acidobacteriota bacterium]